MLRRCTGSPCSPSTRSSPSTSRSRRRSSAMPTSATATTCASAPSGRGLSRPRAASRSWPPTGSTRCARPTRSWSPGSRRPPPSATRPCSTRSAPPTAAARAWSRSAPAPSCSPPPACSTGRRATTHWRHAAELQALHPEVEVDSKVLYVDEGRMLTSAGVAAGIDLCLHVVARDHGAERANAIARRMVVAPHRGGGQAQFVERALPPDSGGLDATRAWMLEHLDQPLTVAAMARHAVAASARSPATSAPRPAPPRCAGCTSSASCTPAGCSRRATCRSRTSRRAAASAPRPRCASTSPAPSTPRPPPTAGRSAPPKGGQTPLGFAPRLAANCGYFADPAGARGVRPPLVLVYGNRQELFS